MLSEEQNELISRWNHAQNELKAYRELEMDLRKQIVSSLFDASKDEGTDYIELGNGYRLKVVKKLDWKLKNDNNQVDDALEKLDEGTAAMLVKWTPTLSVSNFKKLSPELQNVFENCLEVKPAAPSLEIVAPK